MFFRIAAVLFMALPGALAFAADPPGTAGNCNLERPLERGICTEQPSINGSVIECIGTSTLPPLPDENSCVRSCELRFGSEKQPLLTRVTELHVKPVEQDGSEAPFVFTGFKFNRKVTNHESQVTFAVQRPGPCTGVEPISVYYTLKVEQAQD